MVGVGAALGTEHHRTDLVGVHGGVADGTRSRRRGGRRAGVRVDDGHQPRHERAGDRSAGGQARTATGVGPGSGSQLLRTQSTKEDAASVQGVPCTAVPCTAKGEHGRADGRYGGRETRGCVPGLLSADWGSQTSPQPLWTMGRHGTRRQREPRGAQFPGMSSYRTSVNAPSPMPRPTAPPLSSPPGALWRRTGSG